MRLSRRLNRYLPIALMISTVAATSGPVAAADQADPLKLLPPDTILYAVIPNVSTAKADLKKTSMWSLYKDPSMQRFVEPAEKAVREKLDEALKKLWTNLSIEEPPKKLPWPTGRAVLAVQMQTRIIKIPQFRPPQMDQGPPMVIPPREIKIPAPHIVGILEMGENISALKDLVAQASEKAIDKGFKRQKESIRGAEVTILTPPPPKRPEGLPAQVPFNPPQTTICYAFKDKTALVSTSADLLKGVLVRMAGGGAESLADDADMKRVLRSLGGPGDASVYLNVRTIIDFIKSLAPEEQRQKTDSMIRALGFDNVTGLGIVVRIADNEREQLGIKGLLAVRGEKRGIPRLLCPISAGTTDNKRLTKGLAGVIVANYDLGKVYDQINEIVQAAGGPDLSIMLQQRMAVTALNDPASRPPVDLRNEVLGQLVAPLTIITHLDKPYISPDSSRTLLSMAVRDPSTLESALSRIHETFIARGNDELNRELLGMKIFLLPSKAKSVLMAIMGAPGIMPGFPGGPGGKQGPTDQDAYAFAVAGSNLVAGKVSGVEQAIRDLRRKDIEPIAADPMYRYVAPRLPAQAGAWFYENQQITTEALWVQLKETARKSADQPTPAQNPRPKSTISLGPGGVFSSGGSPAGLIVKMFKGVIDFTTLPDFQMIRKYFGASVGYVKGTEQGIYFELLSLKAPPKTKVKTPMTQPATSK